MGLALQSVRLFAGLLTELSIAWHATPLVIQLVPTLLTSVGSDPTHPQSTAQLRGDGGGRGWGREGRGEGERLVCYTCSSPMLSQVLQFGRIENGSFILDFQAPFSPIQAFSVALANLC